MQEPDLALSVSQHANTQYAGAYLPSPLRIQGEGEPSSICKGRPSAPCEMGCTPNSAGTRAQLRPGTVSDLLSFVVVFGSADVNAEFSIATE